MSPQHLTYLSDQDDDPAGPLPPRPAHPLDQPDGRLGDVVADDEVDLADVETLLAHAGRHQGVVPARPESPHNLDLLPLTQALLSCWERYLQQGDDGGQQLGFGDYSLVVLLSDLGKLQIGQKLQSSWATMMNCRNTVKKM